MNALLNSGLFPLIFVYLGLILIGILIIAYTFSMKKSGAKNATIIQNIGSDEVTILTETVLLGHKAIPSSVFFYNHNFSNVFISAQEIGWSFFGIKKSRSFSEIEKVDLSGSSWLLFFFVPVILIGSTSRVIVTFKGTQTSLSFITPSSKQIVAVLKHFKTKGVTLTDAAEQYILQNDAVV